MKATRVDVRAESLQPYRYPRSILLLDGLRVGLGCVITFGPLLFLTVGWSLALLFGVVGLIFLWFGFRVLAQSVFSIVLSSEGLTSRGLRRRVLTWKDLKALKLAYYAPMRRRHGGWYQLTLIGMGGKIQFDSTLIGFDELLRSALAAANQAGLAFDPSTRENLAAWAYQDASL